MLSKGVKTSAAEGKHKSGVSTISTVVHYTVVVSGLLTLCTTTCHIRMLHSHNNTLVKIESQHHNQHNITYYFTCSHDPGNIEHHLIHKHAVGQT